jgi:hypothetical protein
MNELGGLYLAGPQAPAKARLDCQQRLAKQGRTRNNRITREMPLCGGMI